MVKVPARLSRQRTCSTQVVIHVTFTPHLSGRLEVRSELAAVTRADVARLTLYRLTLSAGAVGWRCVG